VLVEYDEEMFAALDSDQRPLIEQIGQALHDLAECSTALVVLAARRFDRGVTVIARYADCVVIYAGLPDEAKPALPTGASSCRQRVVTQQTLVGNW